MVAGCPNCFLGTANKHLLARSPVVDPRTAYRSNFSAGPNWYPQMKARSTVRRCQHYQIFSRYFYPHFIAKQFVFLLLTFDRYNIKIQIPFMVYILHSIEKEPLFGKGSWYEWTAYILDGINPRRSLLQGSLCNIT